MGPLQNIVSAGILYAMSLFGGLDGVVESLPTLIYEEDLLFGGENDIVQHVLIPVGLSQKYCYK